MTTTEVEPLADRVKRAEANWLGYQQTHDVSQLDGKAVGIDPDTGEVFFGASAADITRPLEVEGRPRWLYVTRVGREFYGHLPRMRRL